MRTVSARMVARSLGLARAYGCDGETMCRSVGIDPGQLSDPDGRVRVDRSDELLEAIDARAADPLIGVRLASVRDATTYDAAGLVILAARTLRTGFERAFRCQALWGDGQRFVLRGDEVSFDPGQPHRRAHEIVTECALVEILGSARALVRFDATPLRARLRYATDVPLEEVLGCEISKSAPRSSLIFPATDWDAPLARIELDLFRPRDETTVAAAVAELVPRAIIFGDATLVRIAERLGTSPRTLQRRLRREDTTFERIVDGCRRRLACSLLDKGLAVAEVSALVGYADKAAFYRAYRRWTGTTPRGSRGSLPH